MRYLYFDASALVKRYASEIGSRWVHSLVDPVGKNTVFLAEVTLAEVAAALAAKHRAPQGISRRARDDAVWLFLGHCKTEYRLMEVNRFTVEQAVQLTQNYKLRGYDAIQLATALVANQRLAGVNLPALTFVAADDNLLSAARAMGLSIENPNLYS